jgi:hypothetical protein
MKKIVLTLLVFSAFISTFAQSNFEVNVCGNTDNVTVKEKIVEMVISQAELLKCPELQINNKDWEIETYVFSITTEGTVYDMVGKGNKLMERMLFLIKKFNPEKIYLEKFNLINGDKKSEAVKPLILIVKN